METSDAVRQFIDFCSAKNLADTTMKGSYEWSLGKLADTFEELPVSSDLLLKFIGEQKLAKESRYDLWRHLRTFYAWVSPRADIEDPMREVPQPLRDSKRTRRALMRTLEQEEIDALLEATSDPRDHAMVSLILDTGIRIGEVANLTRRDIRVNSIFADGKTGRRPVPISPEVKEMLLSLCVEERIWWNRRVGRRAPLGYWGCIQAMRKALKRIGIRPPKAGPHVLRHTFGRHYIRNGGGVATLQEIMGHEDISTTMIYVYMSDQDIQAQHAKHSPYRQAMRRERHNKGAIR